jgi:YD repeat-containing protein
VDNKGLVSRYCYDRNHHKVKTIHYARAFNLHTEADISGIDDKLFEHYALDSLSEADRVYEDVFDKAGRLVQEIDPHGMSDIFERDVADLIVTHTDRAGQKTTNEYDLAKRRIAEVLPEAPVTDVFIEGEGDAAKLNFSSTKRRVRNIQRFDKTDKVIAKTHDADHDARTVKIHYDLDGRYTGTQVDQVEVDDKAKTPKSMMDRPITHQTLSSSVVLHASGKPMVEQDEEGAYSFKVYDGLDRLIYQINAAGLVTSYERNAYGSPLKATEYATALVFEAEDFQKFVQEGVEASWLNDQIEALTIPDDRVKCYTYDDEGRLLQTMTGLRYYYEPSSGDFYQSHGLVKHHYDVFGRVIERLTLMDAGQDETWHKHYFWYERGQRHYVLEAESYKGSIKDVDHLFKMTAIRYDVFGDPVLRHQYAEAIELHASRQDISLSSALERLPTAPNSHDRIHAYTFNYDGKETSVKLVNRTHQIVDVHGHIIDVMDDAGDVRKDIELECSYAPRGERVVTTNAQGDMQWAFIDARGLTFATVDLPVVSGQDPMGRAQLAYPLTYFYYNAHGEQVGSKEFWYGADPTTLTNPYELPKALNEAVEHDFLSLDLKDTRGLTKLEQKGTKQTGYSYTATKQKARQFVSRLSDIKNESRVIDEKRHTFNRAKRPVLEESIRGGERIEHHSTRSMLNAWGECVEKAFLSAPKIKSITRWSQGHAWFSHQGNDLPTLEFRNMVGDITLAVRAHDDVLSGFEYEAQAIDFIKHHRYNNRVLKDIKTYDFGHHVLKHEQPATANFEPIETQLFDVDVHVGFEFSENAKRTISWKNIKAHDAHLVGFIRIIQDGINITPVANAYGVEKACFDHQKNRHYFDVNFLEEGAYDVEIFAFKEEHVSLDAPLSGVQPVFSGRYPIEIVGEEYRLLDTDEIDILNVHVRLSMRPHVSVKIELWDSLPASYQTAKLDVRVRNNRGVHYNLVNQAVPNQDDKSSIYSIDGHSIDMIDFMSLNLKPTSFQLTLENHAVIKIGTDLRTINKAKPGEMGDYGLRNYVYMRDCNSYGLSRIKIGNTVYRLSEVESDSINQGKVIDITGQCGAPMISNPDRIFRAASTPHWSQSSEKPRRSNRVVYSTFDVFSNNTTFVNELGHVWQKKYNAYNRVLETLDPEISSMVAPTDTKQGDLTYVAQTTQFLTQYGYDMNGDKIAYAEGFHHVIDGATMKPASTIKRAPNGQSVQERDARGVVTSQTLYSAMKLPVSVLAEGLSQPLRIRYQGKHAQDVLFSGANVGLYMSNQALLYRMYRDPLTHEIIGLGVPRVAGAQNVSFAIASARYDDLGQIHARALPEGQITRFTKDTMGNVLTASAPLSTTTYQRQPFSGLIQKIGDSTTSGNWDYDSNRLNLVVTKTQHGMVHTVMHYNADLLASTHCLKADTLSEYAYDHAGNLTRLMRTIQGVQETMTASYNAVHHLLLTDHTHFIQRYTPDPFYNQVMSELVLKMDGGPEKYTSISLGYSFDDSHRIVRNSVPCSWLRCGFMAHMPTFKQGGIRAYDQRGNLESEAFEVDKYAVTYERDTLARISKVNYYGRGGGSKYLRYDAKGPVRYSVLKQDIQSNTLSETHVRALNDEQNVAFRNGILVIEAWDKSRVDFFVHQLRHAYEYDLNFTTRFTEDTFTSVFNRTINMLGDGVTVQKTFSQVRDKSWSGATIYDYEYWQNYFCYQSIMVLPTRFYSRERCVKQPWGVEGQNTVSYSGSQAVGMQGDGDKVLTTQLSGFEQLHRVTHTDKETLIKKFPQFKSKRHPERLNFYNKQSVYFMMGIHDEYLGSVATTPIQENAWRTTVDGLSPDDAFCLSKPHYSSNIFHGEYVIDPFREPVTRDPDVHAHGEVKVSAATEEIQRNTRYSARLKRDFASGVASSFEQGIKIADPVNDVSVMDAALAPPSWVPLEQTLHISDPMFAHLPAYQKAMLPFIADEKGNLPSGLLLAISQGVMNHLKMGTKASTALAFQQAMQLGAPHAKPYHKKAKEYYLEIFVTILISMIIIAIAPAAAGVLFSIEGGASATALEMGLVTSLLDAGLKGAAYKTHLISHYSLVDSVGVGLSAGFGYGLGVLGAHPTAGLKEVLAYAVANNIETQLTEMAKHHQDGLNIRSLLSSIVTTIARQSVGFRLDMLDGPLGRMAESGQGMLEMLLLDFLGATITGQEVNLKYAVFNSLTSAMMSEVIHAVQADMPSMTPQAKEDKLKGGRNLPPHSKPESQRLGSSQKRYNEKQHQKAILASYGHLPAANDALFNEPVKEFMSDMRHDMSLDFDAETGHLIFDPLENHLHSSHVRVSSLNSGMHSKTTTGQHQQAREHHARARAIPSKPEGSFGGSGLGLFSRPASSSKPSGFMDYVDGVNSARDSTIGMLKQVVYHPLDTVSAPFIGAWHVAHHPKYSYHHAVQSTKDFTEHFAKASGAERFSVALGFVGSGIYGAAFGAGTLPVFGAAAKYGQSLTSRASGFGRIRSVDSSLRLHVENNIVENKLSRETSKFLLFSRRATARGHYASGGWASDRITSHLDGIDFSRRVTEEVIPKGTALQQHQMPGDPIGNYFTLFGADRARLGIYTSGRTTRNYVATRDITALSSTTAGTTDVWSMMKYNWEIMVNGGETQYFTHNIVDWRLTP